MSAAAGGARDPVALPVTHTQSATCGCGGWGCQAGENGQTPCPSPQPAGPDHPMGNQGWVAVDVGGAGVPIAPLVAQPTEGKWQQQGTGPAAGS